MKNFLSGKFFPKTYALLAEHNLTITDNIIHFKSDDFDFLSNENFKKKNQKIVVRLSFSNDSISFKFSSAKNSPFNREKHLSAFSCSDWFILLDKVVSFLADELNIKKVSVHSGKLDRRFLISQGYSPELYYIFSKKIKTHQ